MRQKFRKPRPSAPHWFWWNTDGCWWCDNPYGCTSCGITKYLPKPRDRRSDADEKYQMTSEEYLADE